MGKELKPHHTLSENIDNIEKHMLNVYPLSQQRTELYNMISHNISITYIDMVQNSVKSAKECDYEKQSAQRILINMMVNECSCEETNKFLSDNSEQIALIEDLSEFENLIRKQHKKHNE